MHLVVVSGPSGSGKSTVGRRAAALADAAFFEGDDFHDAAARRLIASGRGLTNDQRAPWLDRIGAAVRAADAPRGVLACSALDDEVRARLTAAAGCATDFVLLAVPRAELARRLAARTGHFAGPSLLDGQLAALDAAGLPRLDGTLPPDALAAAVAARFSEQHG